LCHCRLERASDQRTFLARDGKRRREKNVIASQAVHATLRRIGKHIFFQTGMANFLNDVLLPGKRLARGFVSDEFYAEQQTQAANITDIRMRLQWSKRAAQFFTSLFHAVKKFVRFEIVKN